EVLCRFLRNARAGRALTFYRRLDEGTVLSRRSGATGVAAEDIREAALVAALAVRAQGHDCCPRARADRSAQLRAHGCGDDRPACGTDARQSVVEDSDAGARQRHGSL